MTNVLCTGSKQIQGVRLCASRATTLVIAAIFGVLGCASHEYQEPTSITLDNPLPGQALIYFIRSPYDALPVSIFVSGREVAVLPPESHTAVSIEPGQYTVKTYVSPPSSRPEVAASEFSVDLRLDERHFLVLSGSSDRPNTVVQLLGAFAGMGMVVPTAVIPDSRAWKLYTESDARPMLTITTRVPPSYIVK